MIRSLCSHNTGRVFRRQWSGRSYLWYLWLIPYFIRILRIYWSYCSQHTKSWHQSAYLHSTLNSQTPLYTDSRRISSRKTIISVCASAQSDRSLRKEMGLNVECASYSEFCCIFCFEINVPSLYHKNWVDAQVDLNLCWLSRVAAHYFFYFFLFKNMLRVFIRIASVRRCQWIPTLTIYAFVEIYRKLFFFRISCSHQVNKTKLTMKYQ